MHCLRSLEAQAQRWLGSRAYAESSRRGAWAKTHAATDIARSGAAADSGATNGEVVSVVTPPASAATTSGGAPRFHPVSPARNRPVSPTSSIGSATSADGGELMHDTIAECEDFLEWYHRPEQDEKREAIEARLEKLLAPADKSWRRLHERQLAARSKTFRSRIELSRAKESALLDSFNEEDKKVRARVEKMGTNHLRRVQRCIAERKTRAREVRMASRTRMFRCAHVFKLVSCSIRSASIHLGLRFLRVYGSI